MQQGTWSQEEHDRFLAGVKIYPDGPWRLIARYVGTRSVRQVQTHAQKYHEKIARRMRGLRKERRNHVREEHRIDGEIFNLRAEPPIANFQFDAQFAEFYSPSTQMPFENRAHSVAHTKFPSIHLPPLRLTTPMAYDRDEMLFPDESFDFFTHTLSSEGTSAVV